eukprot:6207079-Pleurochrysis_carterae.AAC.2
MRSLCRARALSLCRSASACLSLAPCLPAPISVSASLPQRACEVGRRLLVCLKLLFVHSAISKYPERSPQTYRPASLFWIMIFVTCSCTEGCVQFSGSIGWGLRQKVEQVNVPY